MPVRFSQDVIPLSDLKINPSRVIKQLQETQRPALLTQRGRGVAVMQDLQQFEALMEELNYLRSIVHGLETNKPHHL